MSKKHSLAKTADDQSIRYFIDRDLRAKPFVYNKSHSNDAYKSILGNIFKTPNDALKFVEYQKIVREFRLACVNLNEFDYKNLKDYMPLWFLSYSYKHRKIVIEKFTGNLYSEYLFPSLETAMNVIERAGGYDNVIKNYFLYNARFDIENKPIRKTLHEIESTKVQLSCMEKDKYIYNFKQNEAIKLLQYVESNKIYKVINLIQKKLYDLTYKKNGSDTYIIDEEDYLDVMREAKLILKLDLEELKEEYKSNQDDRFIIKQ